MALTWDEFLQVELRVGRILTARPFPEARKPAYILEVDFGEDIGIRTLYSFHRQTSSTSGLMLVQPGGSIKVLLEACLRHCDGRVVLCRPEFDVPLGSRLL